MLLALRAMMVPIALAYFFYRSAWALLPLSGLGVLYYRMLLANTRKKQKEQLEVQFKDCILSVAASLKAGYAVENAFLESMEDMRLLYGEHSGICKELEIVRRGLAINIALEELLEDMALRSDNQEIIQFSQVFAIAKKSGGNLSATIRNAADLIGSRIDARQEMRALLGGRYMEQNLMRLIPFLILVYVGISYPHYFDVLYHNALGIGIMTACLFLYVAAYWISERIWNGMMGGLM